MYTLFTDRKHSLVSCLAHVHMRTRGIYLGLHTAVCKQRCKEVCCLSVWVGCCYGRNVYRDDEYHQERIIILFPPQMMSSCALGTIDYAWSARKYALKLCMLW